MILALTPRGDYAADTAATWGLGALQGNQFTHHEGNDVSRIALKSALGTATYILYFGHGRVDSWIQCSGKGYDVPTFVRTIVGVADADVFGPTVVLAFACQTGVDLGPAAAHAGVQRYIGFREVISWFTPERFERVLALAVKDLVRLIITRGKDLTESELRTPFLERQQHFLGLASRGDTLAVTIAGVLGTWGAALTLHGDSVANQ